MSSDPLQFLFGLYFLTIVMKKKKQSLISALLGSNNYVAVNRLLAKKIGLENAYLFQHLLGLAENCFDGSEFFQQQDRIAEELGFTVYKVQSCVKTLVDLNLMKVVRKGTPPLNYYSFNEDSITKKLNDLLFENQSFKSSKIKDLNIEKSNHIEKNNINSNNINNNK